MYILSRGRGAYLLYHAINLIVLVNMKDCEVVDCSNLGSKTVSPDWTPPTTRLSTMRLSVSRHYRHLCMAPNPLRTVTAPADVVSPFHTHSGLE